MTLSCSVSQQWLDSWKAGRVRAEIEEHSDVFHYIWHQCARLTHADCRERSRGGEEWTKGMTHWFMGTPNMWHHGLATAGRRMSESERTMSRMKEWWVTETDPCSFGGGMSVKDRGIEGGRRDCQTMRNRCRLWSAVTKRITVQKHNYETTFQWNY